MKKTICSFIYSTIFLLQLNAGIILYKLSDNSIIDYDINFDVNSFNIKNNSYQINGKQYNNIDFSIYDIATFTDINSNYITTVQEVVTTTVEKIIITNQIIDTWRTEDENGNIITNHAKLDLPMPIVEYVISTNNKIVLTETNLSDSIFFNLDKKQVLSKRLQYQEMVNILVNLYKSFLTNEWTTCLRNYGIIQTNQVINHLNTDTFQNMQYLLMLRQLDTEPNKPTYSYFKNEFESFRINLERLGINLGNLP